ncbi:Mitochondrial carnitine/acylcarnitine carrier-like protein [Capsicum annuum]|nr:Mitochondrial carnitine/acylcarnitine carrier-like protein [Capsicum annuum]
MGDIAKDLTSGTVGGATQLIIGHPFDTIKVKLRSQPTPLPGQQPKYSGAVDAIRQTVAAEGDRGLFKDMGAPLATVEAFNAVLFIVRGQTEAFLRRLVKSAKESIKQQGSNSEIFGNMQAVFIEINSSLDTTVAKELEYLKEAVMRSTENKNGDKAEATFDTIGELIVGSAI